MIPEKDLVRQKYTLRHMRLPAEVKLTKQSLLRWLCLSLGLMSEHESRQSIVPILDALLYFQLSEKHDPTVAELADKSQQPEKAVRYHLSRLIDTGLVETNSRKYRFTRDEYSDSLDLAKSFREHYYRNMENAAKNVEKALSEIQRQYNQA